MTNMVFSGFSWEIKKLSGTLTFRLSETSWVKRCNNRMVVIYRGIGKDVLVLKSG